MRAVWHEKLMKGLVLWSLGGQTPEMNSNNKLQHFILKMLRLCSPLSSLSQFDYLQTELKHCLKDTRAFRLVLLRTDSCMHCYNCP